MKRFALIMLVAGLAATLTAAPKTRSYTDRITNNVLVVTNSAEEGSAFELKRLEFTVPTANLTNTLTIMHNRRFLLPDIAYTEIETNLITDAITTNTRWRTGGAAASTNSHVLGGTSASTNAQVFDGDDFGWGWTFEEEDITTFTFTETNLILHRVYDVYPRP